MPDPTTFYLPLLDDCNAHTGPARRIRFELDHAGEGPPDLALVSDGQLVASWSLQALTDSATLRVSVAQTAAALAGYYTLPAPMVLPLAQDITELAAAATA